MLCIKAVDTLLVQQIHEVYDSILHGELREKVFQIGCQQQAIREGSMMIGDEVVEWGIEKILEVLRSYPHIYVLYYSLHVPCHT